jgi:hypothetical protein
MTRAVPLLLVLLLAAGRAAPAAEVAGTEPTADDFTRELGRFSAAEVAADPWLAGLTAPLVARIDEGSPAKAMGLEVGDHLLALDGLRVIGRAEWDLVRFRRPGRPDGMQVAVLRDDQVLELTSARVLPVGRLGFSFQAEEGWNSALAGIGFTAPDSRTRGGDLPPRAALALLRWHAHRDAADDVRWIPALAIRLATLSAGHWAEAAALPPLDVPASCPELRRYARYLEAIAAYHAQGEQPPDPAWHHETLLYHVIHYPYPRLHLPALGAFAHPDAAFLKGLGELDQYPTRARRDLTLGNMRQQEGESSYGWNVRKALVAPKRHGGWPYRHSDLFETDSRSRLLDGLRAEVAGGGPLAEAARFARFPATVVDAVKRDQPRPLQLVLPDVAAMRARSPLLGYLALGVLSRACAFHGATGVREPLRAALLAGPLPDTAQPSLLLRHLRTHEAGLESYILDDEMPELRSHLALVHGALSRPHAFAELQRLLAADGVATLPVARRQELLAEMLDYVRDSCQPEDLAAMARLEVPGALVDAVAEIARWHAREEHDQAWLVCEDNAGVRMAWELRLLPRMVAAIATIPWEDAQARTLAVEQARLLAGTPYATLVLAEACAAHGDQRLADALRRRIALLHERCDQLAELQDLGRGIRRWLAEVRLIVCSPQAATADLALAAGERCAKLARDGEEWDSLDLYQARAACAAGQTANAVEWLCRSFSATKQDAKPTFLIAATSIDNCRAFRTWLLQRLVSDAGFTPALRQRLVAAARADQVDDGFAGLLQVQRATLTGTATVPGANDF